MTNIAIMEINNKFLLRKRDIGYECSRHKLDIFEKTRIISVKSKLWLGISDCSLTDYRFIQSHVSTVFDGVSLDWNILTCKKIENKIPLQYHLMYQTIYHLLLLSEIENASCFLQIHSAQTEVVDIFIMWFFSLTMCDKLSRVNY